MQYIADKMGTPGAYFAHRWMIKFTNFSIRLHHWFGSDDPEAFHDHSQGFICICLWGGYNDITPDGIDHVYPGSIRYRSAEHLHTVQNRFKNTWTLCIFGKPFRRWYFQTFCGKKLPRDKYFAEIGHHTADGSRIRLRPDGSRITS